MATTAIDTLRFARKLKAAGLPDDQAEAMAAALGEELTEHLATRGRANTRVTSRQIRQVP